MASRKVKSDLLVKTRFQNPIPPPAFPPQSIDIATDLSRLDRADFTSAYAASQQLPFMVDAEIGMKVDLNACEGLWWDEVDPAYNPAETIPDHLLDPEDLELLAPADLSHHPLGQAPTQAIPGVSGIAGGTTNVQGAGLIGSSRKLRRDGEDSFAKERDELAHSMKGRDPEREIPNADMLSQLQAIERTFWYQDRMTEESIRGMKHPTKKGVVAVDSFELLPDEDIWGGNLNIMVYTERPNQKSGEKVTNEQLLASVLRPRNTEDKKIAGAHAFIPEQSDLPTWRRVHDNPMNPDEEREMEQAAWDHVKLPFSQDYTFGAQQGPAVVLTFCDGQTLQQQDEHVGTSGSSSSDNTNGNGAGAGDSALKTDSDDSDDDDIFGEKDDDEEEDEEKVEAKRVAEEKKLLEEQQKAERLRAKGRGIFWTPIASHVYMTKIRAAGKPSDQTLDFSGLEDNWDDLTIAYQHMSENQIGRREMKAGMLEREWETNALQADFDENELAGEGAEE